MSPVALGLIGLWPPLSVARIGYASALILSFDASRGMNSSLFRALRVVLPPFRGLRAPARFSIMVGLTLAILAGYGVVRLTRSLTTRPRWVVAAAITAVAAWELTPRLELVPAWMEPPRVYDEIRNRDGVVLAEFPTPDVTHPDDARATYFSTFHWRPIVSGISGHYPASYLRLLLRVRDFPNDEALAALRERGVTHVVVHGGFYEPSRARDMFAALDARQDVAVVATAPFATGQSRLYRLVP